jgi:hypothetical protein
VMTPCMIRFVLVDVKDRVQLPTTRLPTLMVVRHHQAILHVTVSSKE